MPGDLLDQIRREIRARKQELQAADEESQRLERALVALGASAPRPPRSKGRRPAPRVTRKRAPARARRGANREAILAAAGERPGATAREIADFTGIARTTVASTVTRLAADGVLERTELPAGGVGLRPARAAATD